MAVKVEQRTRIPVVTYQCHAVPTRRADNHPDDWNAGGLLAARSYLVRRPNGWGLHIFVILRNIACHRTEKGTQLKLIEADDAVLLESVAGLNRSEGGIDPMYSESVKDLRPGQGVRKAAPAQDDDVWDPLSEVLPRSHLWILHGRRDDWEITEAQVKWIVQSSFDPMGALLQGAETSGGAKARLMRRRFFASDEWVKGYVPTKEDLEENDVDFPGARPEYVSPLVTGEDVTVNDPFPGYMASLPTPSGQNYALSGYPSPPDRNQVVLPYFAAHCPQSHIQAQRWRSGSGLWASG